MARIPEMWRNDGNVCPGTTSISPLILGKLAEKRDHILGVSAEKTECNGGDNISLYMPLNALKPTKKLSLVPEVESYHAETGLGGTGGQTYSETIKEWSDRGRHPFSRKTLQCVNSLKYLHTGANYDSPELPYWKHADKKDPPIRTLFRAKKWIDSDERGCKRVSCVLECARIDSKNCACSSKRIGVTLSQRDRVMPSSQVGVCTCEHLKKQWNHRLHDGKNIIQVLGNEDLCPSRNKIRKSRCDNNISACDKSIRIDRSEKHFCACGNGMKAVKMAAVQSSKCFYMKQAIGSSYLAADNKMVFQNSAYVVPNLVHAQPGNPTVFSLDRSEETCMKSVPPEKFVKGCCVQSLNVAHNHGKNQEPIFSQAVPEQYNGMSGDTASLEESCQKFIPEGLICQDTSEINKTVKLEGNAGIGGTKEPKTVLDVLEVDTLAKANNILEKIASTLDQIKVLSQSALPHESAESSNKVDEKEFSGEGAVNDESEKKVHTAQVGSAHPKTADQDIENNCIDVENMKDRVAKENKVEKPANEEKINDGNGNEEGKGSSEETDSSKDPECDDLNAIPLKITKAVSAFKTVESNTMSVCKIYKTVGLKDCQEAKKSYSINVISQRIFGEKDRTVGPLLKAPPKENVIDCSTTKGNEIELKRMPNKTNILGEADALPLIPSVKKPSSPHNEGMDQKSIATAALQSVLKSAISPRTVPIKEKLNTSTKGKEEKAETIKAKVSSDRAQSPPEPLSRLTVLAQPKTSYMRALKHEFKNFMDKPMLERLNRLLEPAGKLQSPCLPSSKPPVPPLQSPSPKRTGPNLRNKSVDSGNKRNTSADMPLKKPHLRPKTTPYKPRGEVVTQQAADASHPAVSAPRRQPIDGKHLPTTGSTRPTSASDSRKGEVCMSPMSGDEEKDLPQQKVAKRGRARSPLGLVNTEGVIKRSRSRQLSPLAGMGQMSSEIDTSGDHMLEGKSEVFSSKNSLLENLADSVSTSRRTRARTCTRRTGFGFARYRRFATCCFPLHRDLETGYNFFGNLQAGGGEDATQRNSGKDLASGSVNVSLTLKNENADSTERKADEVLVKSSKEANNQIIFNVYQMAPDKKASSELNSESGARKAQREEQDHVFTPRVGEEIGKEAPVLENVGKISGDSLKQGIYKNAEMKDAVSSRPYCHVTKEASGEADHSRAHVEAPYPKCFGMLQLNKDTVPVEGPCGKCEGLFSQQNKPQYQTVGCGVPMVPFGQMGVPVVVGAVACECGGLEDSSNASKVYSEPTPTETRTVSSVPSFRVSDHCQDPVLCTGCLRSGRNTRFPKLRKGKPLPRPFRDTTLAELRRRERLNLLSRTGECFSEEDVGMAPPPTDTIPTVGAIRNWLRDSNVEIRRWSSELTFKVDVGTSVSGFHVAVPAIGDIDRCRLGRGGLGVIKERRTKKDVACTAKRSSMMVRWGKNCESVTFSKNSAPKVSSVLPFRSSSLLQNSCSRKKLIIAIVYVCMYTFLGWVVMLPSFYI